MNRIIIVIAILLGAIGGVPSPVMAQAVIGNGNLNLRPDKTLTVDTAQYKVIYEVNYLPDTLYRDKRKNGRTLLLTGKHSALYIDYYKALKDSVRAETLAKGGTYVEALNKVFAIQGEKFNEVIVLDYPTKGSSLVQEYIGGGAKRYIDNGAKQNWAITDDTENIAGYECHKATCNFRGRDYTAWYTEEIPIPRGPFLFTGLPGLIVKLTSSEGDYDFTLIGFQKVSNPFPMDITDNKNIEKISREDFRFLKTYYKENPVAGLANGPIKVKPEKLKEVEKRLDRPRSYNPIEKE